MDDDKYNLLEQMLLDSNKEPTDLPLSLLKVITKNFSEDRKIGRGGFADVYEGILDIGSVAVKRLFQAINLDENDFNKEVTNLVRVKHQNVVRFLGYCADTQRKVEKYGGKIVMADVQQRLLCFEFLPNGSLDKHIIDNNDASGGLEWRTYYQIIKGLCQGLDYLHQQNIVHLDLKPANILLDGNMVPKISDFGLSRCFDEKQTRAITAKVVGTLGYMAPEFINNGVITIKSDIYSLGIIIIEILTGQKGYLKTESVLESWCTRFQMSHGDLWLEHARVCAKVGLECMDSDPEKRPTTRQIIERLDKLECTYGFIETNHSAMPINNKSLTSSSDSMESSPGIDLARNPEQHHGQFWQRLGLNERALNIIDKKKKAWNEGQIRGTVVLVKKEVLDVGDFRASLLTGMHHSLGDTGFAFQLVSTTKADPSNGGKGTVGKPAHLEELVVSLKSNMGGEAVFRVNFEWDESQGIPGAILVRNLQNAEFFLKTLTLEGVPAKGAIVFVANSWIYPHKLYSHKRIFFANNTYLPSKMPAALVRFRQEELEVLRGDDKPGPYEEHDRVYRYDYYNDLGEPDEGKEKARPILGGNQEHPYPRRCRTGRPPTKKDPNSESRLSLLKNLDIYVPRDERFRHLKMSDFLGYSLKTIIEAVLPTLMTFLDDTPKEFDSFEEILGLYELGPEAPNNSLIAEVRKKIPSEFLRVILPNGSHDHPLKMPIPNIIKSDVMKKAPEFNFGWRTDEEFARETLAGVNPVIIKRLTEFPAKSTLDPSQYGDHTSKITEAHIQHSLEGLPVQNALKNNRLFIIDHHDHFMPYLNKINKLEGNFIYASRTLLFLKDDGTLKPLAIELSLPHPDGQQHGAVSKVYTPAHTGVEGHIWRLAKAYACVNDSAWHQLISHWLNTHAVIEPFAIATNRQLSVVHPVHKLLQPHYHDTLNMNALARQTLINAGGIFELTMFPAKYALAMSSEVYNSWNFNEQALPADLVKRGVAVPDESSPYGVRLLIKDYPYAVDGLMIWWAIEQWVKEYLNVYYSNDGELQRDVEVQAWWKEVREEGHGDLKDRDWWPRMDTVQQLARTCTTIIWVASALHAAVNFGQYAYAGYFPNRPTVSRQPMPEPGSQDYGKLEAGQEDADKVFIRTFTSPFQTILGISIMEILSKHTSDEVYLGQRDEPERWTSDAKALYAFEMFGSRLMVIEKRIEKMNGDPTLKNRNGPVGMPYMLLYPNTSDITGEKGEGLTAMGIPNSISI